MPGSACFGFGGTSQPSPTATPAWSDGPRPLCGGTHEDRPRRRPCDRADAAPLGLSLEEAADGMLPRRPQWRTPSVDHRRARCRPALVRPLRTAAAVGCSRRRRRASCIETVVVPRAPANFSAWGILSADHREDVSTTRVRDLDSRGARDDRRAGCAPRPTSIRRLDDYGFVDELVRSNPARTCGSAGRSTRSRSTSTAPGDRKTWLRSPTGSSSVIGGCTDTAIPGGGRDRHRAMPRIGVDAGLRWPEVAGLRPAEPRGGRDVWFREAGGQVSTAIYERDELMADQVVAGPALVEEWTSTVVVPPGWPRADAASGD